MIFALVLVANGTASLQTSVTFEVVDVVDFQGLLDGCHTNESLQVVMLVEASRGDYRQPMTLPLVVEKQSATSRKDHRSTPANRQTSVM